MSTCKALLLHPLAAGQLASPFFCSAIALVGISLFAGLLHCGKTSCFVLHSRVGPGLGAADASNSRLREVMLA